MDGTYSNLVAYRVINTWEIPISAKVAIYITGTNGTHKLLFQKDMGSDIRSWFLFRIHTQRSQSTQPQKYR